MDQETTAQLYKANFERLYRYCAFKVGDKCAAEDIVADAFLELLNKDDITGIDNLQFWLWGTTRNLANDYLKRKIKSTSLENFDLADEANMTKEIEQAELTNVVKVQLRKLKPIEQEIVILKIWEELQFQDVARIVSKKLSAVKFTYYQALEKLKVAVGERESSKKLYGITAPLLLATIKTVSKSAEYLPAPELASNIFSNLFVNIYNMSTAEFAAEAAAQSTASIISTKSLVIMATVAVASLGLGAGVAVLIFNNSPKDKTDVIVETTIVPTAVATTEPSIKPTVADVTVAPTADVYAGWKTYTNTTYNFQFMYPPDWLLEVNDVVEANSIDINVSKQNHFFQLFVGPTGPEICVYPDTADPGSMSQLYFDEYVELTNGQRVYRRGSSRNGLTTFQTICYKDTNGYFTEWSDPGILNFEVTSGSFNNALLSVMEKMVLSYKKI